MVYGQGNTNKPKTLIGADRALTNVFDKDSEALRVIDINSHDSLYFSREKTVGDTLNAKIDLITKMLQGVYSLPTIKVQSANGDNYIPVQDSWEWARYIFGANDTLNGNTPDTMSRRWMKDSSSFANTFSMWWAGDIEVDDTAEVSTSSSFAAGTVRILLPYKLYPFPKMNIAYKNNLFIRRKQISGGTGTVTWNARFWGF